LVEIGEARNLANPTFALFRPKIFFAGDFLRLQRASAGGWRVCSVVQTYWVLNWFW